MNSQQSPYYPQPPPPQGHAQYQGAAPQNAPGQGHNDQPQPSQNETTSPSYQGHAQYPHYQSSSYQVPLHHYQHHEYPKQRPQPSSSQTQIHNQSPYNAQPLQPSYQGAQTVQPVAQQHASSTGQSASQPRPSTPGQLTPTYTSSNQIAPGGAPARQYMNEAVAPYLLEGMKMLVREQPPDPLRVLGEWLIEQHNNMNENEAI